jgi:hypothetical protein
MEKLRIRSMAIRLRIPRRSATLRPGGDGPPSRLRGAPGSGAAQAAEGP